MMTTAGDLFWNLAVLAGWLAAVPYGLAWLARRRFRRFLKLPLTEEAEALTHRWERRAARWTALGLGMSGFSILCLCVWLAARAWA